MNIPRFLIIPFLLLSAAAPVSAVDYEAEVKKPAQAIADISRTRELSDKAVQKIAVMDFKTVGESTDLGEGAAEILRTTLIKTGNYTVVERSMLKQVLREQKLGLTGVLDQDTAIGIGKILKVQLIAVGSVVKMGETYTLNVRFVNVETGEVVSGDTITAKSREELPGVCEKMVTMLSKGEPDKKDTALRPGTKETTAQAETGNLAAEAVKAAADEGEDIPFSAVMANPDDPALNYKFARTQVRKGDLKGAAATLERMLMVNPALDDIRLFRAAVLYRMDALGDAAAELETLKSAKLPPAMRAEADNYGRLIARRSRTVRASGSFSLGAAYDSNRNASPASEEMLSVFGISRLTGLNKARGDASLVSAASAEIARPFSANSKHEAFVSGVYYRTDQNNLTDISLQALSARAGARLRWPRAGITPALIYDRVSLDGEGFMENAGASLRLDKKLNWNTAAFAEFKYLDQDYSATAHAGNNRQRSGGQQSLSAGASRAFGSTMRLEAALDVTAKDAKKDYYSTDSIAFSLRHSWMFSRGVFMLTSAQLGRDNYRRPDDAMISPKARKDSVMRAGITLGMPVSALHKRLARLKDMTLALGYEHYRDSSNITNYTYDNDKCNFMITYRWEAGLW